MNLEDNSFKFTQRSSLLGVTTMSAQIVDFAYDKHMHEEYSLGVTLAGRQDFFCAGKQHKSTPGNVMLFNPGEVHDGHSGQKQALKYTMLYVCPDVMYSMMRAAGYNTAAQYRFSQTLCQNKSVQQSILRLTQALTQGGLPALEIEAQLYALANEFANQKPASFTLSPRYRNATQIVKAVEYIHDNIRLPLTMDDICQAVDLSKYYFIRLFKQTLGLTPYQYVINCRINCCKSALARGGSVTEVAYEYGFSDVSHFNRRFIPLVGITPYQYRRQFSG